MSLGQGRGRRRALRVWNAMTIHFDVIALRFVV
jgi:hypothetical protein